MSSMNHFVLTMRTFTGTAGSGWIGASRTAITYDLAGDRTSTVTASEAETCT